MKNKINKIILAGASSIFGYEQIKEFMEKYSTSISFVETSTMAEYAKLNNSLVGICNEISIDVNSIFIPLNEFWLTYGMNENLCRISKKAYLSSRSKTYFSKLLKVNGVKVCKNMLLEEAVCVIKAGGRVVIKPDSYYSGHGVKIVDEQNYNQLEEYYNNAKKLSDEAKRVLLLNEGKVAIWEYLNGEEYSADVFVSNGFMYILRFSRKEKEEIYGKPCVIGYISEKISKEVYNTIKRWTDVLFEPTDVSFGQFDFIKTCEGYFIPIDFSARVGGGIEEMLKQYKNNIYLEALKHLFITGKKYENGNVGIYQLNILPIRCGMLFSEVCNTYGNNKLILYKHKGEYVNRVGASANDRIGCIIGKDFSKEFFKKIRSELMIGDKNIG